jgi:hypothetical protein
LQETDLMLEWVLSLLVALGLAAGGVAGVTTTQSHQGQPATDNAPVHESSDADTTDVVSLLGDLAAMISDKLSAAAEKAAPQAQDALDSAAEAAADGLSTASDAVSSAGAPAEVPGVGTPSEIPPVPGAGDHPGP